MKLLDLFEGILSAGEESNDQPETVEVEAQEEVLEEEVSEGEEEVVTEDTESQDEGDEEVEVEEEDLVEETPTYTVKAAGEEKQVTLDELMQGYQLGADYTKKTQEVAEQRKAVEHERKAIEEAKQVRDHYAQRLESMENMLEEKLPTPEELARMKDNDPIGYAMKSAERFEQREQLEKVKAERQRIAQQQQVEYQQQLQQRVYEEQQKLSQILPEFSDPTKGEQLRSEIRNYGKNIGFTDEELANVYDSRHVLTLHKAMMYDKLQKSKPEVTKKVAKAPKMVKSGTKVKEANRDVRKKQMNRLKQTGRAADAAVLFENFIS